jgi:hypothetical protein
MTKTQTGLAALCIAFLGVQGAVAIAVDDYAVAEADPNAAGYSLDWDYIYQYKNSSSVAVDHYWILTAAHVADDGGSGSLVIGGETYTQEEVIVHPTADLALVRYDKPFPGYYPLHDGEIYTTSGPGGHLKTYQELIMSGYGRTGTVTAVSFTNGPEGNGIKRWGTNKGTGESSVDLDVGGTAGERSTLCFETSFILTGTTFEAGAAQYDSGGPVFIEDDGTWKVAGINLYLAGADPYTGNSMGKVSFYRDWITNNIPDYDTDMDGLPDWWETSTGETESEADPDADGFTNYEEWLADTDPILGSSYFQLTSFSNGVDVVFASSTNREYQIEQNQNLTNADWTAATDWISGSQPTTSVTLPAVDSNLFYRVRAKLP